MCTHVFVLVSAVICFSVLFPVTHCISKKFAVYEVGYEDGIWWREIFLTLCCVGKEVANLARKYTILKHRMLCILVKVKWK